MNEIDCDRHTLDSIRSIAASSELQEIIKKCASNFLFAHRYTTSIIQLLEKHAVSDPELLLLSQIAIELGIAKESIVHSSADSGGQAVIDVAAEEYAIYGEIRPLSDSSPKAISDRSGSKHRRPQVSVFEMSGTGLHIGFFQNFPLVVRQVRGRLETPIGILPSNHRIINLIGGLPVEVLNSASREVETAVFIGDSFAFTNYAHWTLDWFPRLKWIIENQHGAADLSIIFNRKPHSFHFEMLAAVGFRRENIVYPEASVPSFFVKAKNIVSTNIGRDFRHSCHAGSSWSIDYLRSLYNKNVSPFMPGIRVVIIRPKRGIIFSEGALSFLKSKGFIFVILEFMDHKTQVALFSNASMVIASHGAGLSNLVFCKPGTKVLEVFNETLSTHAFYTVAHFGGLDYSCAVSESKASPSLVKPIDRDGYIDEEMLLEWFMNS